MKKTALILIVCILINLTACQAADKDLNFPGLQWGMTLAEVQEELSDVPSDTIRVVDDQMIVLTDYELFDSTAEQVLLVFHNFDGTELQLVQAIVKYPASADISTVLEKMESAYGEDSDELTRFPSYAAIQGGGLQEDKYEKAEGISIWKSVSLEDATDKTDSADYFEHWQNFNSDLTRENWDYFTESASLTSILVQGNEIYFDADVKEYLEAYPG